MSAYYAQRDEESTLWIITKNVTYGLLGVGTVAGAGALTYWAYQSRHRLQLLGERKPIRMIRNLEKSDENEKLPQLIRALELNPAFREKHKKKWRLVSLGEYLSQLECRVLDESVKSEDLPKLIQEQVEATLTATLIKALGPSFGAAALPVLGVIPTEGISGFIFRAISGTLIAKAIAAADQNAALADVPFDKRDRGSLPLNLAMFGSMAEMRATVDRNMTKDAESLANPSPGSSLGLMSVGEVAYDPHYGMSVAAETAPVKKGDASAVAELTAATPEKAAQSTGSEAAVTPAPETKAGSVPDEMVDLIPNPFVVSEHWSKAIEGMEKLNEEKYGVYDGESRFLGTPQPINDTLLPGLHLGWGDAKCTHTVREILQNRLLACILNRLGYNYHLEVLASQGDDLAQAKTRFMVLWHPEGELITRPAELVGALIHNGHQVSSCPRSTITTFGAGFCIKEADGGWSNVPLGLFIQTGYESKDGVPAHFFMPHSGIDLDITGPLFGKSRCNIQNYLAIEGMSGWHSNHNCDVPWVEAVDICEPFLDQDVLRAVTMAALSSVTLNTIATEMELPNGGYGLTGVCNDTAAVIEYAMRGSTSVYPITYSGRFMMHAIRVALRMRESFSRDRRYKYEVGCLSDLITAMTSVPNDQQATPSNAKRAIHRMIRMMPPFSHQLTVDAKVIMNDIDFELNDFAECQRSRPIKQPQVLFASTVKKEKAPGNTRRAPAVTPSSPRSASRASSSSRPSSSKPAASGGSFRQQQQRESSGGFLGNMLSGGGGGSSKRAVKE